MKHMHSEGFRRVGQSYYHFVLFHSYAHVKVGISSALLPLPLALTSNRAIIMVYKLPLTGTELIVAQSLWWYSL